MASNDKVTDEAYVTLATTDAYALGALVLARSLQQAGTTRQMCVMVTDNLSQQVRQQLGSVFDHVQTVNVFDSEDRVNLTLLNRPDLGVTFTKLHCWRLTQYRKCVFMDADTLVRENIDELFEREELSAAPDVGWPDCFNSGVFVFSPSMDTYQALLELALTQGSFDGGDQGLLNLYFSDWGTKDIARHLPFIYNCVSTTFYTYKPALKQFGNGVKVVHFIGARKPWHYAYNTATGDVDTRGDVQSETQREFLQMWWQIFMRDVQNTLQSDLRHLIDIFHSPPVQSPRDTCPRPTPVMTSPYMPPEVERYYTPPPPPAHVEEPPEPEPWAVVENKDDRQYTHHETFYAEQPMMKKEEMHIVQEIHDTHNFHETLAGFEEKSEHESLEKNEHHHQEQHHDDHQGHSHEYQPEHHHEQHQEHHHEHVEHHHHEHHHDEGAQSSSVSNEEHHHHHDDSAQHSATTTHAQHDDTGAPSGASEGTTFHLDDDDEDENKENSDPAADEVAVSDDVAHVVAGKESYSDAQLADIKRQYQWEKGQIDYLGIDSFENIQKRLDHVMVTAPSDPTATFTGHKSF